MRPSTSFQADPVIRSRNVSLSPRGWFIRNLLLPLGDRAFGQQMMSRLRFLEAAQWWDRERLESVRTLSLRELIKTAYDSVPFYTRSMDASGVRPADITTLGDLSRLPIVTKDMLRPGYPHLTTRKTRQKTFEKRTSGSTGKNFIVAEDSETAGWYRASLMLAFEWSGWRIGEEQLQTGMTFKRGLQKRLKDALLGCHYVSAAALDDRSLDLNLELMDRRSIRYVWGYPGSIYLLARRAAERGWNRPLKAIVTWGDNLYPGYRRTIEAAFQTRVYDTYGCAEGIEVAAQCGVAGNYHLHALDVIVEYVDEQGQSVPADRPGRILLTRLHAGPMPLIRYQVGDIGVSGDQRLCPCGRGFQRMHSVEGRDTDVVVTPSGNRLIVHYFTGILEHFAEIDSFQVRQDERSSITVLVTATREFTRETPARIVTALQQLRAPDLKIHLEVVDSIPIGPSGKRRFVINNLTNAELRQTDAGPGSSRSGTFS